MKLRKKLIEVALLLDTINKASAREKSIRPRAPQYSAPLVGARPLATARHLEVEALGETRREVFKASGSRARSPWDRLDARSCREYAKPLGGPVERGAAGQAHAIVFTMEEREPQAAIPSAVLLEWEKEFEAAARRPLQTRLRYAFVHTYKPVLDDAPYRSFSTTAEYRAWCAENLPDWLGYGPAVE